MACGGARDVVHSAAGHHVLPRHRDVELRYDAQLTRLPTALRRAFVELDADASTRAWIDAAFARPDPRTRVLFRTLAMLFVNVYDADAWADVGQDRLLSTSQWRLLPGVGGARLLDVGAGSGKVTRELAPLFAEVITTERSRPRARRLRDEGFRCHERDIAFESIDDPAGFDVVALQNVIDRTTHPLRLLDRVGRLLAPGGRLVVAVPVPIRPVVFVGRNRFDPAERLPVGMADFESTVDLLYERVFRPRGYRVTALTRAPYFSRGSSRAPVHVLDDAIFVLTRAWDRHEPLSARRPSPCGNTRAATPLPGRGTIA